MAFVPGFHTTSLSAIVKPTTSSAGRRGSTTRCAAYQDSPSSDPSGDETATARVVRGGSWGSDARYCRAAYRDGNGPQSRNVYLGFRVAAVPPSPGPDAAQPSR